MSYDDDNDDDDDDGGVSVGRVGVLCGNCHSDGRLLQLHLRTPVITLQPPLYAVHLRLVVCSLKTSHRIKRLSLSLALSVSVSVSKTRLHCSTNRFASAVVSCLLRRPTSCLPGCNSSGRGRAYTDFWSRNTAPRFFQTVQKKRCFLETKNWWGAMWTYKIRKGYWIVTFVNIKAFEQWCC